MSEKKITPPKIGELWAEQGGIYCGMRLIDGVECHIITPAGIDHDLTKKNFDEAEYAQIGEINGHSDWYVGDQEDYMLAYINVRMQLKFDGGLDSVYWKRSFHHGWPWAVDFEFGLIHNYNRYIKCRARPFRRFVASSI
jgi:hypothetical protein